MSGVLASFAQVIEERRGLHPRGVQLLPWHATKYPGRWPRAAACLPWPARCADRACRRRGASHACHAVASLRIPSAVTTASLPHTLVPADFFLACYALIIRATGSVELVDEIEQMLRWAGRAN